ncbi:glycosyltransferase family 2 protein [Demequina silvatica]|uniref:glycosyltransferase family 2 protein n=1 Tax=Demequina silvatica TaxID=1638988 RepID=UPI000AABE028|nr:cellulose synthase catalytic subunit [Demequina silvatica]
MSSPPAVPHRAPVAAPARTAGPSPVMTLLVILATIGILGYSFFLLNPANRGDVIPWLLVITAETVLVFHALLSMWTILAGTVDPRDFAFHQARESLFGRSTTGDPTDWPLQLGGRRITVDVFITVYGEPLDVVRRTIAGALAMDGRHRTWVLDDGDSDEVRDIAAHLGARYVRRLGNSGAKAGNINHALTLAKGEFFAVFDADFVPDRRFLLETVPFFADAQVAFVQTPQTYGNLHTTIAKGAGYMQTVFYRFVQPGRNRFNAAFCVGTNVVFRRTAVEDVGGIYTDSKSEDVWTSLLMHERGWRTVFIPTVLAIGDAPDTVEAYAKQQLRWATGGFEILLTHNPLSPRRRLTADQRIQYFVTATFYLTGITPLLLLLVPPLEIYFDLRPMSLSISVTTWLVFYAGFYVMQIGLAWFTLGTFRWQTLTLATVSFPIYLKALVNAMTSRDVGWTSTGSTKARSPFNFIVPQVLFFLFLALTSVVAVWRDWDNGVVTLATAWNLTNTLILGAFLLAARREARALRRGRGLAPARTDAPEVPAEPTVVVARPVEVAAAIAARQALPVASVGTPWTPVEAPTIVATPVAAPEPAPVVAVPEPEPERVFAPVLVAVGAPTAEASGERTPAREATPRAEAHTSIVRPALPATLGRRARRELAS